MIWLTVKTKPPAANRASFVVLSFNFNLPCRERKTPAALAMRRGLRRETKFLTMTNMHNASSAVKSSCEDTPGERDLLLTALRAASARSRLITNELDSIGVSLRHRAVTCAQALKWLRDEDLLPWVHLGPEVVQ
jgi:hypothetical protein